MVPHPPALEYALQSSSWSTRGWTFQERHLSTRCIYFSSDFVYFQCAEGRRCETGGDLLHWPDITPSPSYTDEKEEHPATPTNPLLSLGSCAAPSRPATMSTTHIPTEGYKYRRHRFDLYREIVETYSRRQLSFATDVLNAFTGVAGVLERNFETSFVYGLPACFLDHALLWAHECPWDRRLMAEFSSSSSERLPAKLFPSWSWAGWAGSVQYLLVTKGEGTYQRQEHEYAKSEISHFQTFHKGVLHEVFKDAASMAARETRNLGSYNRELILKTYPLYVAYEERRTLNMSGPDLGPGVLQFWADAVDGDAFTVESLDPGYAIVDREHGNVPSKQAVIRLLDRAKVHCGLMLAFESNNARAWHRLTQGPLEWIAISSFGDAHDRRGGLSTIDVEVRPFDERKLPYKGEGSGLVNIMLIEWDNAVAGRITIAQVHGLVWEEALPVRKHIRLA
ncbi:hypothetical protein QBC37DRAFT_296075 [Rhypophila decipiens]|uniref:Heterokaryon incompatibility domain-containing protein n=1 Tax=Rhypophila decipiens TaxID=261697 RepID=A0AAN6Y006_9PEZI|nr:hypothetical protein QBC37DRAFT_296075 [Rhypophila decipiens]